MFLKISVRYAKQNRLFSTQTLPAATNTALNAWLTCLSQTQLSFLAFENIALAESTPKRSKILSWMSSKSKLRHSNLSRSSARTAINRAALRLTPNQNTTNVQLVRGYLVCSMRVRSSLRTASASALNVYLKLLKLGKWNSAQDVRSPNARNAKNHIHRWKIVAANASSVRKNNPKKDRAAHARRRCVLVA